MLKQTVKSQGAVGLAKMCQEVAKKSKVDIIPVVSALDGWRIKSEVGGKVFVQNVDEYDEGAKTGHISPAAAKELNLDGSLLNHSECRKKPGTVRKMVKAWPDGFVSVVCLQSLGQAEGWGRKIKADFIDFIFDCHCLNIFIFFIVSLQLPLKHTARSSTYTSA